MLQFGAAASTATDHQTALDAVIPAALATLSGPPDLAVCFFSMEFAEAAAGIALAISERTGTWNVLACTAQGVIGVGKEIEETPALSLWLARLPGVDVQVFDLRVVRLDEAAGIVGWPATDERVPSEVRRTALLLADPFTFPAAQFLARLNDERSDLAVVGGMVSGAAEAGLHRLVGGTAVQDAGAVGALLTGPVEVRTVVSQGCRPIGKPYVVTRAEGNVVHELGGVPAVERLRQLLQSLDDDEARLVQNGLQIGTVIDEQKLEYGRGDFLIRGLVGADPATGAIAVGDRVDVGRTLQFHVRDAAAADEDLDELLAPVPGWSPRGALLFSCNGRGRRFFGAADHDAAKVNDATRGAPTAGFFAQGELGPVGGRNFVHAFTASIALFCEPDAGTPARLALRTAASADDAILLEPVVPLEEVGSPVDPAAVPAGEPEPSSG